ncbi:MAG: hypothetical protein HY308_00645 [Gammaproteobacteria bacterium]|nr:hypothetical protein [Gammaproteobacteria bacterium]
MKTLQDVKQYIIDQFIPDSSLDSLDENIDLIRNGIIDSLGVLKIVSHIENELKKEVPVEDITPERFKSVAAIYEFIRVA